MQADSNRGRRLLLSLLLPCFYTKLQCLSSELLGSLDVNFLYLLPCISQLLWPQKEMACCGIHLPREVFPSLGIPQTLAYG